MELTIYIGVGLTSYALFAGLVARLWEAMGHEPLEIWDNFFSTPQKYVNIGSVLWPFLLTYLVVEFGLVRPLTTTYRLTRGRRKTNGVASDRYDYL